MVENIKEPLVTVLMSVYNGQPFLKQCIDSIIGQTYEKIEFIIINDGSTDKTEDIILSFKDDRIVYIRNEFNIGLTASLNFGIRHAKGDFIARMDSDDVSSPDRIMKQVNAFIQNPEYSIISSNVNLTDAEGNKIGELNRTYSNVGILGRIFFFNPIVHPSVMIKKCFLERIGGYDLSVTKAQDYELWFRMVAHGAKARVLPDRLLDHREHDQSIESKHRVEQEQNVRRILQKWFYAMLGLEVDDYTVRLFREGVGKKYKHTPFTLFKLHQFLSRFMLKFMIKYWTKPWAVYVAGLYAAKYVFRSSLNYLKMNFHASH